MSVTSRSGKKYLMNIIDDFTSYIWSIPLSSKDEAAKLLPIWQRAVENQSSAKIKMLVTDNGELVSRSVTDWCSQHGIEHKVTAPYTSAQNG
jgi:transposase InsO family protein